jgi:hypothetical protein
MTRGLDTAALLALRGKLAEELKRLNVTAAQYSAVLAKVMANKLIELAA